MTNTYLEFVDFYNNHILQKVLAHVPYIHYPVEKRIETTLGLQCIRHYIDFNIYQLSFRDKIYYIVNEMEKLIREVNHYLLECQKENMDIYNRLEMEVHNYDGNILDDDYSILRLRMESVKKAYLAHRVWTEPFRPVEFIDIDKILPIMYRI